MAIGIKGYPLKVRRFVPSTMLVNMVSRSLPCKDCVGVVNGLGARQEVARPDHEAPEEP